MGICTIWSRVLVQRKLKLEKRDRDGEKAGSSSGQYSNYTPLNTSFDQVLMQIKDDPSLKWPERMKEDPSKRNKSKYCRFHCDHGHDTNECYDLKQQIEVLIRQGKLKNFLGQDHKKERQPMKGKAEEPVRPPFGEIKMIVGGMSTGSSSKAKKTYLRVVQNFQLSRQPLRMIREEDARRLHHPHDDVIVITLVIANYMTKRVLVDNGSLTNILYYPAFQQMRINKELLHPMNVSLIGFRGMKVLPLGTIFLPVMVGSYPRQINKKVNFLVVDCSSSYNAIIGRPTLYSWRVATSTYHFSVKFPTEYGIGEVQGDQLAARECYLAMLAMDNQMQMMNIEERRVLAEPIEALKDVLLDESNLEKFTRIGTSMEEKMKQDLVKFLR
ncbi:uncharacterized protein LOC142635124 [Castanea sativa]|uniref:uncharacterized protein LOC142635124 n=1 Tax=Castanea sativa TaxID=21020 RepID=UPI003F654257